jgi:hypothetical protein
LKRQAGTGPAGTESARPQEGLVGAPRSRHTGRDLSLLILGGGLLGTTGLGQIPAEQEFIGEILAPSDINTTGTLTVSVVDESGAHLADGTLTISP